MTVNVGSTTPLLAIVLLLASSAGLAQTQVGATELARAKTLLDLSRAELTAEQFTLLDRKLVAARSAYAEFTTAARVGRAAVVVTEGSAAASASTGARATVTGGRALLGGAAELLPFLLLIWPSTAHAPGIKHETPEVHAARGKLDEKLKELADAARQVESEVQAAVARAPKPTLERCMHACEGDQEARAAFGRTLPNETPEQKRNRARYFETISQSTQLCQNMCRAIFVR